MAAWKLIVTGVVCCAVVSVPSDQERSSDPSVLSLSVGVVVTLFGLLLKTTPPR